jgi:biotin carboxyl carrier protein
MSLVDEAALEGEFPPISERFVVAPSRGRLHHHRVRVGRRLEPGSVIGELRTIGGRVQLRSPLPATFISWLAREGEAVDPGRPLAIVLPAEDEFPRGRSSAVPDIRFPAGPIGSHHP